MVGLNKNVEDYLPLALRNPEDEIFGFMVDGKSTLSAEDVALLLDFSVDGIVKFIEEREDEVSEALES